MNYKKIIISIALLMAITGIGLLSKQTNAPQYSNEFIVGTVAGYAPFVSINPQGQYEGFDIDVANQLANQMGKKLVLKDLGCMTSLFAALDQGSIDAIIWGLSITQDRLKKVAMIHYHGEITSAYPLIFWKTIPEGITSIADMQNKTVCVEPASAQDVVLSKYSFINTLPTDKVDDALLNIQYGKADAAFVEPAIAKKFKNKYPEVQILNIPLTPEDQVHGIGIVIKQNNAQWVNQVQKAVDTLKSTNIIRELDQKWDIS